MKVPLLDLQPQLADVREPLEAAVLEVLASGRYVNGPRVEAFEAALAESVGTRFAVGVSSGTDALLASLMALGVESGDRVVTPTYSFFATAGVVARLGAVPVFVDVDPDTWNMDPAALRACLDATDRVRAVVPVHLYGQCADMEPILEAAAAHGVPVLEDAAQAIGARYPARDGEKQAGSMGVAGCFSFFPTKNLGALGDAGAVTTDDAALYELLLSLRDHGARERYHHDRVGGNFRLDALQAAALQVKLPHAASWHAARRSNAAYYDGALDVKALRTPTLAWSAEAHVYNQYIVTVSEGRDELRAHLADCGVGTEVYYPVPFHLQACFADLGYGRGDFPTAEYAAAHTLALPVYPGLTREMQDHVIESIRSFFA